MDENAAARAENEALLRAQVDRMRWRAELPDGPPRLTFARALRRILCSHNHGGGMVDDDMWVSWCRDCGHSEIALAPLAPDERWFPEGRSAWNSSTDPVREFSLWRFAFINLGLALSVLALVLALR